MVCGMEESSCVKCGVIGPKLRTSDQLKIKDMELNCPIWGNYSSTLILS